MKTCEDILKTMKTNIRKRMQMCEKQCDVRQHMKTHAKTCENVNNVRTQTHTSSTLSNKTDGQHAYKTRDKDAQLAPDTLFVLFVFGALRAPLVI